MDAFVTSAACKGKQPAQPQQDNPVAYELPWSVRLHPLYTLRSRRTDSHFASCRVEKVHPRLLSSS